ncbi:MAG: Crp/Fnr family transcriptional regulator [Bdellovibrionales bacterium]
MAKITPEKNYLWDFIFKKDNRTEEWNQIEFLQKTNFFSKLKKSQIKRVLEIIHIRKFREDEFLFEQGNPGAALFFIQEGEVSIELVKGNDTSQVAILGENTFLGEIALLSSDERTASARAIKTTKCLALYRNDLQNFQITDPDIASEIYRSLAHVLGQRLTATNQVINRQKKEIQDLKEEELNVERAS